ncbi:GNAT family N-acetyltransferase [Massilia sp. CMS3.1]|uniref:GNAT family N-acetyltransferase n=1 Tax=Massilia sp. CMS3.1 TaxID=3373083 RepID=UPI003EE7BF1F
MSSMNIFMLQKIPSYRRATVEDLSSICDLGQVVNRLHHEAWPQVFASMPGQAEEEAHWLKSLQGDAAATFLAYDDHEAIVGFVTVQILEENHCLLEPLCFARVGTLCVVNRMRGQGIGRTLMEHAEQWAIACGAKDIRLEVWKFNASAIRLYEELGYEIRSLAMSKPTSA